ncbi:MAG: polysaccharide biosynthesis protein [Gemmatales bacterium]|nr:polysaccharide biosynthesis protein [Gemmatales bacterium]MCS7159834.1 polysaccharide biosynthesis protein [Gemmatales bacterium]MDW8175033.1 polysaccharide biosynthesis protein [Gemmatales bacterium]MDW8224203.1 polysaccharide biosynthesis protein [Gemmatales bacterium]
MASGHGKKCVLITGATGSLGGELVARYYPEYQIFAQGRNADKLLRLKMRYPHVEIVLGDLRAPGIRDAVRQSQVVIHTAAQKYVNLAERHCFYTVDTNVNCTFELADLAARQGVERFVFISTDKSSFPTNVYGITKYLAERIILELAEIYPATKFVICRFGNIFGSNGSVVQLWLEAKRRRQPIQVTDPNMTRFMFSLDDAAETVHFALTQGHSGDIIIPKMKSVCLRDLMELFGDTPIEVIGRRPGEKVHETLYIKGEIDTGYETDKYYVLNARAPTRLSLRDLNSAECDRVPISRLRHWLKEIERKAA